MRIFTCDPRKEDFVSKIKVTFRGNFEGENQQYDNYHSNHEY